MPVALTGATIFDGESRISGHALVLDAGRVLGILPPGQLPEGAEIQTLEGGLLTAGFVDLQVNGGGGVMLNDAPEAATMETIAKAHLPFGTTSLLPTLITDTQAHVRAAIAAAKACTSPGVAGLHLEGPHLSVARKGAHDAALIRAMSDEDLTALCDAAQSLPSLYLTVAPESVTAAQIRHLVDAGAIVSLGHSDCGYAQASAAYDAGATAATHLFNAMSQLTNREPGMVGALLNEGRASSGVIADGIHVHPATLRAALAAKQGPGRLFLVSDAMATIGTDMRSFTLNGREILRENGRLTLGDGTLAGADLDMISAVRFMVDVIGLAQDEALRMASAYPADLLGRADEIGRLRPGTQADILWLGAGLEIQKVWQRGKGAA
ncbi:N-acetylglucosamine-6-phosphate deacetylase [Abyssibius alkaniclasticus]|uniref:N-acetylglucosamine-6-phosphate deacetylase n=1 Tax=Abyssibius alkaniclasticus TaxID=2881234 RepID=UPI0023635E15|nr:N-acetylglucosamine-6-phosphate deacetylase [Abyssibius alkaniclasticus]UPH71790.1 N-acetylglucosamine-6-phosphate deacetylase [Abyssibius alkaniclasticus]